jgi:hypothetical protein
MNPIHSINQEFTRMVVAEWSENGEQRRRTQRRNSRRGIGAALRALAARIIGRALPGDAKKQVHSTEATPRYSGGRSS